MTPLDWTKLLADAGIPEPPGYHETTAACLAATAAKKQAATEARQTKGKRK